MLQAEKLLPDELRLKLWLELRLKLQSLLPDELQHLLCTASDLLRTAADLLCSVAELLRTDVAFHGDRSAAKLGTGTGSQRLM